MFAVILDKKLVEYEKRIIYALDYLFNVLGYSYRVLKAGEIPGNQEIPFMYLSDKRIVEDYLSGNPRGFAICVLHDRIMYEYENLGKNEFKSCLHEFNIGYEIPYICSRDIVDPISRTCDSNHKKFYVGVFHFDLIGNILFNLNGGEQEINQQRDQHKRFMYQKSMFSKYLNYPYITGMIRLIDLFLEEGETFLNFPLVQKPVWQANKQYAVCFSHNVDKLTKWNLSSFFKSIIVFIKSFWRVGYHLRNFWGLIRYLFDNWEPYWNFDLITEIEKRAGITSTYFFGVKSLSRWDIDYNLEEDDIRKQKEELLSNGNKLGLLSYYDSINEDDFEERSEVFEKFSGKKLSGLRQNYYKYEPKNNSIYYWKAGFMWDSSWSMSDFQGYINGIGMPFYLMDQNYDERTVLEIPVNFDDLALYTEKGYLNKDKTIDKLEELIDNARKFRSLLVFNFNLSSFEETRFLEDVYKKLIERIKGDPTVWKSNLEEINHWYRQREGITIKIEHNEVEISSKEAMPKLTLYMKGMWRVSDIHEREISKSEQEEIDIFTENTWWKLPNAEMMVTGRLLEIKNIQANCRIRIEISRIG